MPAQQRATAKSCLAHPYLRSINHPPAGAQVNKSPLAPPLAAPFALHIAHDGQDTPHAAEQQQAAVTQGRDYIATHVCLLLSCEGANCKGQITRHSKSGMLSASPCYVPAPFPFMSNSCPLPPLSAPFLSVSSPYACPLFPSQLCLFPFLRLKAMVAPAEGQAPCSSSSSSCKHQQPSQQPHTAAAHPQHCCCIREGSRRGLLKGAKPRASNSRQ